MKNFNPEKTDDVSLFRVCDLRGDWTHYYDEKSKRSLRAVNYILDKGYTKGDQYNKALMNSTPETWEKKMTYGQDRGDAIHQEIKNHIYDGKFSRTDQVLSEDNVTLRNLTSDEWLATLSFVRFANEHAIVPITQERAVKNLEVGYAGTFDLIAYLTKSCEGKYCKDTKFIGKLGLWDHKSGKGIYDNYGPQVASYSKCDMTNILESNQKIEYTAIDHIGTSTERGYDLEFYDQEETEKHWKEFLAADTIMRRNYKGFDLEKMTKEIPDTAEITFGKLK
jgi:hypothetical protein